MQDVLLSWVPDDDRMYRVILNGGDLAAAITQLDEIGDSSDGGCDSCNTLAFKPLELPQDLKGLLFSLYMLLPNSFPQSQMRPSGKGSTPPLQLHI